MDLNCLKDLNARKEKGGSGDVAHSLRMNTVHSEDSSSISRNHIEWCWKYLNTHTHIHIIKNNNNEYF